MPCWNARRVSPWSGCRVIWTMFLRRGSPFVESIPLSHWLMALIREDPLLCTMSSPSTLCGRTAVSRPFALCPWPWRCARPCYLWTCPCSGGFRISRPVQPIGHTVVRGAAPFSLDGQTTARTSGFEQHLVACDHSREQEASFACQRHLAVESAGGDGRGH